MSDWYFEIVECLLVNLQELLRSCEPVFNESRGVLGEVNVCKELWEAVGCCIRWFGVCLVYNINYLEHFLFTSLQVSQFWVFFDDFLPLPFEFKSVFFESQRVLGHLFFFFYEFMVVFLTVELFPELLQFLSLSNRPSIFFSSWSINSRPDIGCF